jgi:hypothetical protein
MSDVVVYLTGFALFAAGWMARSWLIPRRAREAAHAIRMAARTGETGEIYRDRDITVTVQDGKP